MLLRAPAFSLRTPLLLAGAAALAAPLAFLVAAPPVAAPQPIAALAAPLSQGERETRSYSYYPEQLAALSSLNSFAPIADPGQPVSATAPVREAPQATRHPVRPAERRAEPRIAAPRSAPPAVPVAAAAATEPTEEGWKVFGLAVPKPSLPDAKTLREKAAGWSEAAAGLPDKALALGAGVTRLWRAPDPDAPAREK